MSTLFRGTSHDGSAALYLTHLILHDFRNFSRASFTFARGRVLVLGDNGQGKTNLLEAISYPAVGRSARAVRDREVVHRGASSFALFVRFCRGGAMHSVGIEYTEGGAKRVHIDGAPAEGLAALVGRLCMVAFFPQDVELLLGVPAGRRRMLDVLLAQMEAPYFSALRAYRRALEQRNAWLRLRRRDNGALEPWDVELARHGATIVRTRLAWLSRLNRAVGEHYRAITGDGAAVTVTYEGPAVYADGEDVEGALRSQLRERRGREWAAGHTLCGPHREGVSVRLDGQLIDAFGSRGQQRMALLAWRLAERDLLAERHGEPPVVVLDDALSELDAARSKTLWEATAGGGQTFVSSARAPSLGGPYAALEIVGGRLARNWVVEADADAAV